ncbi:MAG: short-chain dehydrogenase/reductase [Actinomycetia bacterium]|nr:short-chain dehydrogenase/reductase [Actinomycetes bacterium]
MINLDGKVAIVTGAASGIGAVTACTLADAGASVLVADLDAAGAVRVAAKIAGSGGAATAWEVDVSDDAAMEAMVAAATDTYGGLDILHNNAAASQLAGQDHQLEDTTVDLWDRTMAINLRSVMLGCKHAVPAMKARGGGSIINASSGVTHGGQHRETAYAVSKAGVEMLTKTVATQYGRFGIRCNAIAPGVIFHDAIRNLVPPADKRIFEEYTLLPRLGEPEDIANAVAFLASDLAGFITGQVLTVDGGLHTAVAFDAAITAAHSEPPA